MNSPREFKTERDLCAAFIEEVNAKGGWTVYPETAGFDMVLVRNEDGFQIAVEAKLRLNAKVIAQILPTKWSSYGHLGLPDCRAVLVPEHKVSREFKEICAYIGVTVIVVRDVPEHSRRFNDPIWPSLPGLGDADWLDDWHEWCPETRIALPEVVPDCEAGCPAPLMVTQWKIKAMKLAIILERFGYVTAQDFRDLKLNPTRWLQGSGWLRYGAQRGVYVGGDNLPNYRAMHPKNFAEIEAKIEDWLPAGRRVEATGAAE